MSSILSLLATSLAVSFSLATPISSVPSHSKITTTSAVHLIGRVNPSTAELSWPGNGLAFTFTGTQATINFASLWGQNGLTWVIDNTTSVLTNVDSSSISTPTLAQGTHQVAVYKRSEGSYGSLYFGNVTADGPITAAPAPARKIEFIGDSITVGYGEDGTLPCVATSANENNYLTYGQLTARNLSAEASIVAWSGKGVTRNYVTSSPDTSDNMTQIWTRYAENDADNTYTFPASSTPDAVVINLGTNDFSYLLTSSSGSSYDGRAPLDNSAFAAAYLWFVNQVRARYPAAHLFLVSSPMLQDSYPSEADAQHTNQVKDLQWVVQQANTSLVSFVDFASATTTDTGCDYHPSPAGHALMADVLIPAMKSAMGW